MLTQSFDCWQDRPVDDIIAAARDLLEDPDYINTFAPHDAATLAAEHGVRRVRTR